MQHVVEELVLFVPQRDAFPRNVVERLGNVEEVFEKLGGDILVGAVLAGQFQGDHQHIQAVHPHPGGTIGLFQVTACACRASKIFSASAKGLS